MEPRAELDLSIQDLLGGPVSDGEQVERESIGAEFECEWKRSVLGDGLDMRESYTLGTRTERHLADALGGARSRSFKGSTVSRYALRHLHLHPRPAVHD